MNIGGLSGTTSNSIRGYGGLASGLDRDALIEGMSAGTMAKIEKQMKQKTLLQWEQTGIRDITDKLTAFADKYTSTYSSGTNLFSSSFWGRNNITALGSNSKYVSVSGSANTADNLQIQSVKQLAEKAQLTSSGRVSDSVLKTGEIDLNEIQKSSNLEGKTLEFTYGDKDYTVILPTGKDKQGKEYKYDTVENAVDSMKRAFEEVEVSGGKKLSDVIKVEANGKKVQFTSLDEGNNILKLKGGSAVAHLGFTKTDSEGKFEEINIKKDAPAISDIEVTDKELFTEIPFIDRIAGKQLTFNYNGTSKTITMPGKEELEKLTDEQLGKKLTESMQSQLDQAFGKGRIKVEFPDAASKGSFTFKTTEPSGALDNSSILTLSSGDAGMLGKDGAFKTNYGEANRLNLDVSLSEAGFSKPITSDFSFKVNGVEIKVSKDDTMRDIMERINKETDVEVRYQASADKFVFTSKEEGASGKIQIESATDQEALKNMFGDNILNQATGKDAIITIKHAGSNEEETIVRGSNTIKIDGLTITVNGKFDNGEPVTFDAKVDDEKIVNSMKDMVKEFNEIIELVNKSMSTKPNRDYPPLTAEQKKEMSKSEIEAWEEKAKEGLLFNDNDIKGLSNGLRFVLGSGDLQALEKIGITVSSTASDNGKLTLDEAKFKAALASDPEGVRNLFTKEMKKDAAGNVIQTNGIATNMKNVLDKYAKTIGEPKGILIRRAGSIKSPASITQNEIQKKIAEVDKRIATLQSTLKREQDRYIRQFTTLESLIAQMNSQSSALSQFGANF